jgi:hypothetical protein
MQFFTAEEDDAIFAEEEGDAIFPEEDDGLFRNASAMKTDSLSPTHFNEIRSFLITVKQLRQKRSGMAQIKCSVKER